MSRITMHTSHSSWWYRGWLVGLMLAASLTGSAYANAQLLFVSGGAAPDAGSGAQLGSRLWLSDLFQIQGAVSVRDRVSAEATGLRAWSPAATSASTSGTVSNTQSSGSARRPSGGAS